METAPAARFMLALRYGAMDARWQHADGSRQARRSHVPPARLDCPMRAAGLRRGVRPMTPILVALWVVALATWAVFGLLLVDAL